MQAIDFDNGKLERMRDHDSGKVVEETLPVPGAAYPFGQVRIRRKVTGYAGGTEIKGE